MTATLPIHAGADKTSWSRRAWVAIALWPVGLLAGTIAMYLVAIPMGVIIEPAGGEHASLAQRVVILGISGLVWLISPAIAFLRARHAVSEGSRSGRVALVVSIVLGVVSVIMTVGNIIDPGNML
jgi:hypothetical protein